MKIAMLGWEFPPFMAGGLGIHCLELTQQLARRGVQIDFYMPHMTSVEGPLRVASHHRHLKIHEVEADPGTSPYGQAGRNYDANFNKAVDLYNKRLVKEFRSGDADLLHCHDWITVPAALELRRRWGIPLVFTVHSIEHDRSAGFFPQKWIEDIERRGVREADRVITVSNYTKGLVVEKYGADPSRIRPVHNGVDPRLFVPPQTRDYNRRPPTVLFLSRVSRQKGPLFFLQAAKRVLERRRDVQFLMVGKGEMLPECVRFVVDERLHGNVRFTGFVPDALLPQIYHDSDVYVLPSVSEPFGISILEAMAAGLPTIVSRTTGVGEALHHVFKIDFWDADGMADVILNLLAHPQLREELGRNGAKEVPRFTWESCAAKTMNVYQEALPRRRLERMVTT